MSCSDSTRLQSTQQLQPEVDMTLQSGFAMQHRTCAAIIAQGNVQVAVASQDPSGCLQTSLLPTALKPDCQAYRGICYSLQCHLKQGPTSMAQLSGDHLPRLGPYLE